MKTYKDIYEFPLKKHQWGIHIWDNKGQMVAQFHYNDDELQQEILNVLNDVSKSPKPNKTFYHEKGYIKVENSLIMLIRGWGNLTGIGGHNLSDEEAANVQDTFAEFIVNKLNGII